MEQKKTAYIEYICRRAEYLKNILFKKTCVVFKKRAFYKNNKVLKGLTKFLERNFYSNAKLPKKTQEKINGTFKGRRRGTLVDRQISRMVNKNVRLKNTYKLTRLCFDFLEEQKLVPVVSQIPVSAKNIGTAADLIVKDVNNNLILIEIKSGFFKTQRISRTKNDKVLKLKKKFHSANDTHENRHI